MNGLHYVNVVHQRKWHPVFKKHIRTLCWNEETKQIYEICYCQQESLTPNMLSLK